MAPTTPQRRSVRIAKARGDQTPASFHASPPALAPSKPRKPTAGVRKRAPPKQKVKGKKPLRDTPYKPGVTTNVDPFFRMGANRIQKTVFEIDDSYDLEDHSDFTVTQPNVSLLDRRLAKLADKRPRTLLQPIETGLANDKMRALENEINALKQYWTLGIFDKKHGDFGRNKGVAEAEYLTQIEERYMYQLTPVIREIQRQFWGLFQLEVNTFVKAGGVDGWGKFGIQGMLRELTAVMDYVDPKPPPYSPITDPGQP